MIKAAVQTEAAKHMMLTHQEGCGQDRGLTCSRRAIDHYNHGRDRGLKKNRRPKAAAQLFFVAFKEMFETKNLQ